MKRVGIYAWLAILVVAASLAQHQAPQQAGQAKTEREHGGDHTTTWKWANFVLLAGGLGYLIHKKGGAFFRARSEQIRGEIADAARIKQDAENRHAQLEQRLAGVEAEIESLRTTARDESAAEGQRVRHETERELKKIQAQAEREIVAAAQAARQQLRAYSAELAIALAAQRIRGQMTAEVQDRLVLASARELERVHQQPGRVS